MSLGERDDGGRRRFGVRRANTKGPRPHRVVTRLSEEEFERIGAMASVMGVTIQNLFVSSVLSGGALAALDRSQMRDELRGTRLLLARTATNLNQMAKVLNAGGEEPAELRATLVAVERMIARLNRVIDEAVLEGER